jgi:hypothetical protein
LVPEEFAAFAAEVVSRYATPEMMWPSFTSSDTPRASR